MSREIPPDRWRQISQLYHAALAREDDREAFLDMCVRATRRCGMTWNRCWRSRRRPRHSWRNQLWLWLRSS